MSGKVLQDAVATLARTKGWRVVHFSPGRVGPRDSWITNYAYDSKGWPDLFMVRGELAPLAIEVKGDGDSTSKEQDAWLAWLLKAGCTVAVVTPQDWRSGTVDQMLDYTGQD